MNILEQLFGYVGTATWGWALIPFLVVIGGFFTIASGFVQLRFFRRMFRVLFEKTDDVGEHVSGRAALLLSIGGRVGGGNVAGVAVAISLGGPGAVFWMWAIALIGMATSLIECSLAQLYKRSEPDGTFRGGPAQYIIHGLGHNFRWLAVVYAVCLIASFGLGFCAFQGNTVAGAMLEGFGVERLYTAIAFSILTAAIVFGGVKVIARAADIVVPVMTLLYVAFAIGVMLVEITSLPGLFVTIVKSAFGFNEAIAGGIGAAVAQGVRRGLFSNEAGLGSAPNVAAIAYVRHPVSQGVTQSLSVFIDTFVICTSTAMIILLSGAYQPGAEMDGVVLTQESFDAYLGDWSSAGLALILVLFAFSSIIYNYYLGETGLAIFTEHKMAQHALRAAVIATVFLGALAERATSVFFFSDPMMGILAMINLLAIVMLFPTMIRLLRDYQGQLAAGVERPKLDPEAYRDLDVDPTAWR